MNRQETLDSIRHAPDFSVLVIGAGINGVGTFRDLALQGIDVLIVDRGDFCSGASMASSHMVHGGVRYLENGEFRLVREAVKERNLLLKNAPHYVKPLPTTFPVFKWLSGLFNAPFKFLGLLDRPAERGAVMIKIGMVLYDTYTRAHQSMPEHTFLLRKKSLEKYPELNPDIIGTATYYDAAMPSPERLCVDLLFDGEAEHGRALAVNYVSAVGADGGLVELRDELSGETFTVRPHVVVNAAGPWIDFANRRLGRETAFIGGTKGSHIVVDNPRLAAAIGGHEFFFENKDGRIVLIFPLEDKVLIGTSDIRTDDPDDARCTDEEIAYFLELVRRVFPAIEVDRSEIVFRFSGVRPLPASKAGFTGQISRDHSVELVEPGEGLAFPIYNLIGGKWTTFRAFSEQAADTVLKRLGVPRRASTELLPIGGGRDYPRTEPDRQRWLSDLQQETGLPAGRLGVLLDRYGTRAHTVAAAIAAGQDAPLAHQPGYSRREIAYLAQHEKVIHLDDILLRRSLLAWLGHLTPALLEEIAGIAGEALGWSDEVQQAEIRRTQELLADHHGVTFA